MSVPSFSGKTVLVTGAAGGIGGALTRLLAEGGAKLVVVDIDPARLDAIADEVRATTEVLAVAADVSNEADVQRVYDAAIARFGQVDALASNAAIIRMGDFLESTVEDFDVLMDVNARSGYLFVRGFARAAKATGTPGSIVVTSSIAGIQSAPGLVSYSMTKSALLGLTRSAAVELAPLKIRVNAVCPGRVNTDLLSVLDDHGGRAVGVENFPISRMADPREIANLIAWLLSDAASFVTGSIYPVDGGRSA
jgi:NAD(P)-dependent dehydrogenase (short-subunit alcohol dehydrogenase family)